MKKIPFLLALTGSRKSVLVEFYFRLIYYFISQFSVFFNIFYISFPLSLSASNSFCYVQSSVISLKISKIDFILILIW